MPSRTTSLSILSWISLCSLCLCGETFAAAPRDELLRLVPGDAGFCVVLNDLRGQIASLQSSPFAARLAASRLGVACRAAPEAQKLIALERQLSEAIGVTWPQLRDDILGDAVVLAYVPGPPDHPEQEQGLFLVWTRQPERLAGLIATLNELQLKSGELREVQPADHAGTTYQCRRKRGGGDEFYCQRGPVLIFTNQEATLRQALDRDRQAPLASAEPSPVAGHLQRLGVERNLLVGWVNPRAFDTALRQKKAPNASEAAVLGTFARYWQAFDGAALFVNLECDFTFGVAMRARTGDLPPAARRLLAEAAKPSPLAAAFPDNALVTVVGRVAWPALIEAGGEFLTAEARQSVREAADRTVGASWGPDFLGAVLDRIGPDWGLCIVPPAANDPHWLPHLFTALRLRPGPSAAPVEQRAVETLKFFATLALFSYNSQHPEPIRLGSERQGLVEVHFLSGAKTFPPGVRPAFAWKDGYLVLASSPEAVRRFTPPAAEATVPVAGDVPILRVSLKGWVTYLQAVREPLASFVTEVQNMSRPDVERRIDGLLDGLSLFDRLELSQRPEPGRATLMLQMRPAVAAGAKKPR